MPGLPQEGKGMEKQMTNSKNLKQFYYCPECEDFYVESGIVLDLKSYLPVKLFGNIANCPKGHVRSINKEYVIYLPEKPNKINNSSIVCLDIKDFSEKNQMSQFNNISILHAACVNIKSEGFENIIYKGTGDGFVVGLPSNDVSKAIQFCEQLIGEYLKYTDFITYRIGIDYGVFFSYMDLNDREDLFGQTVDDAFRIADFGNNNHILLSKKSADNLMESEDIKKDNLTKLGWCFDKHRKAYKVYNYKSESIGAEFA